MTGSARRGRLACSAVAFTLIFHPFVPVAWAAVIDISGSWDVTETVEGTCSALGETADFQASGSGVAVIEQNGASIAYTVPQTSVRRTGTIEGNMVRFTGPMVIALGGIDLTFTVNQITATGSVAPNRDTIPMTGAGTAAGTGCIQGECASFTCSGTSRATFRRPLVSVALQAQSCGGTVLDESGAIVCGPDCAEGFARGTTVALNAIPSAGATFRGWTGPCQGRGTCRFTVNSSSNVGAQFACASPLVSAVLPASRSVQANGAPATAFATLINTGATAANGCVISKVTGVATSFMYQATNGSTPAASPNTPVTIAPGAAQNFVISLAATNAFEPTETQFAFTCAGLAAADSVAGLNTLLLSASTALPPDIVALAATVGNNGIVDVHGARGAGAFSVATVNVGASAPITASVESSPANLPLTLRICRTDPATGACVTAAGPAVSTQINSGETPTFAVFVTGGGNVVFDPAGNRVFVRFRDASGRVRGATSVAVRTVQ